jgi:hypothetical protein
VIFTPVNAEEISHAFSSQTWLSLQQSNFYLNEAIYESSGSKTIDELGDHDIKFDSVCQTDLLDGVVAEDKCMFTELFSGLLMRE